MALRIRKSGEILCAAVHPPKKGDTYIDDSTHYMMSVVTEAIYPSRSHEKDGKWYWNVPKKYLSHVRSFKKPQRDLIP